MQYNATITRPPMTGFETEEIMNTEQKLSTAPISWSELNDQSDRKDAERYRKLRDIALKGDLEETIALGQFDFISDKARFDDDIDLL